MSINANTEVVTASSVADVTVLPHAVELPTFLESTDLEVYECVAPTGETVHSSPTLLSAGGDYSVSQNDDGSGTLSITNLNAASGSATIVVVNNPAKQRTFDLVVNGRVDSDALEAAIDALVLQQKLLEFQLNRTLRFDHTSQQAGIDDVAPLTELEPLTTEDHDSDYIIPTYDKTTGKFSWALNSGDAGPTGPAGPTGATGATGATGPTGPAGSGALPFAGMAWGTPAASTIVLPLTPVKAAGATTAHATLVDFTVSTANLITYTGVDTIQAKVTASLSLTASQSNTVCSVWFAKNGGPQGSSKILRKIGTGSDAGALSVEMLIELATSDTIEVYVSYETDTGTITIEEGYVTVLGLPTI